MFVVDTNVVSELMKSAPDDHVKAWLSLVANVRIVTTAVTVVEVEYGLQRLPAGKRRDDMRRRFEALIYALPVLPLEEISGIKAGQFRAIREAAGQPVTASDMMIAGIAAAAGAGLATRNVRDFAGLPLTVVDPWSSV